MRTRGQSGLTASMSYVRALPYDVEVLFLDFSIFHLTAQALFVTLSYVTRTWGRWSQKIHHNEHRLLGAGQHNIEAAGILHMSSSSLWYIDTGKIIHHHLAFAVFARVEGGDPDVRDALHRVPLLRLSKIVPDNGTLLLLVRGDDPNVANFNL